MSFGQLDNCTICGKLFVKGLRDLCNDCYKSEEEQYNVVYKFLKERRNSKCTIYDVSDATKVSIKLITKFIKQGRISLDGLPNLGFPCESCGMTTRDGNLCINCRGNLSKQMTKFIAQEEKRMDEEKYKIKDLGYMQAKDDPADKGKPDKGR